MKKLTEEHIKFIDDRLYNLGVEFMDIRYEMVDHIASELEAKEGDFSDEWTGYFIMNRIQLLEQNKRAKHNAILRAMKLYFKTLVTPLVLVLAVLIAVSIYYGSFYIEDNDIHFFGMLILMVLLVPMIWFSRKNKKLSVMRPMVLIQSVLYSAYQLSIIAAYSIESDDLMAFARRITISIISALMLVLAISLYKCRKQYVGKYI